MPQFLDNDLLFPTFSDTMQAFWANILNGVLPNRAWSSIKVLLMGYAGGRQRSRRCCRSRRSTPGSATTCWRR